MICRKKKPTKTLMSCNRRMRRGKNWPKWKLNFKFIAHVNFNLIGKLCARKITSISNWIKGSSCIYLFFSLFLSLVRAISASLVSRKSVLLCFSFEFFFSCFAIGWFVHIRFIIYYRWKWDMWKIGNEIECTEQWLCMYRPKCVAEEDGNKGSTCY